MTFVPAHAETTLAVQEVNCTRRRKQKIKKYIFFKTMAHLW